MFPFELYRISWAQEYATFQLFKQIRILSDSGLQSSALALSMLVSIDYKNSQTSPFSALTIGEKLTNFSTLIAFRLIELFDFVFIYCRPFFSFYVSHTKSNCSWSKESEIKWTNTCDFRMSTRQGDGWKQFWHPRKTLRTSCVRLGKFLKFSPTHTKRQWAFPEKANSQSFWVDYEKINFYTNYDEIIHTSREFVWKLWARQDPQG